MNTTRGTTCPSCKKDVFVNLPDMKKGQRHTLKHTCCGHLRKVKAGGKINAGDPVVITPAGLAIAVKDYPEPIMEEVESLASRVERLEKGVNDALELIEKGLKELVVSDPDEYYGTLLDTLKLQVKDVKKFLLNALKK